MDKDILSFGVAVAFVLSVLFGAAIFGTYLDNRQALSCMDINKARPASDVALLCGRIKK